MNIICCNLLAVSVQIAGLVYLPPRLIQEVTYEEAVGFIFIIRKIAAAERAESPYQTGL